MGRTVTVHRCCPRRPPLPPLLVMTVLLTATAVAAAPAAAAAPADRLAEREAAAVQLAERVAAAVQQLLRPAQQPLLVFSCGAGPVPLDRLLAALRWPHGLLVTDCGRPPCPAGQPAWLLYSDQPGPRLLLLQEAGCLNGTGAAPPGRWSRGQALHLTADCDRTLSHALFAKVGRPVCLETGGSRLMVAQRATDGTIRRSGVRASHRWLLAEDNLTNTTINVVYDNYSPFFDCDADQGAACSKPARNASGVLLEAMSRQLGFHLRYYRSPDGNWGHLDDNGTWVGMVSEVKNGYADLAVGGVFITALRATAGTFSRALTMVNLEIVSRPVPLPLRSDFTGLLAPPVWALIAVSLMTVTAVLLAPRLLADRPPALLPPLVRQLEDCYRVLVAQEAYFARSAGSMLLAVWLLSSIVHRTALTTNMISALSAPAGTWSPESFSDLVQHGYRVVTHPGYGAYDAWMRAQRGCAAHSLRRRWTHENNTDAFKHIVSSRERVALLEETPSVMNLVYDAIVESDGAVTERLVHLGREKHMPSFIGWLAQKHAPYVRRLDEMLRLFQPMGLVSQLLEDGATARREEAERRVRLRCRRLPETCHKRGVVLLGLTHLSACFKLLIYGLLTAGCCLLLELLVAVYSRRRGPTGRTARRAAGPGYGRLTNLVCRLRDGLRALRRGE